MDDIYFWYGFFESAFLSQENTKPSAKKQMQVSDARFWPLPLTMTVTTCVSSWHKKISSLNSETEHEETDKDEEIVPKKAHTTTLFWK